MAVYVYKAGSNAHPGGVYRLPGLCANIAHGGYLSTGHSHVAMEGSVLSIVYRSVFYENIKHINSPSYP